MATVRLEKLRKVFDGNVVAVHELDLVVRDKGFVVLVGPSGCGKSTTLRMIAGLEEISSGSLFIDDVLVNDVPAKDRDIAMVFQNYALYPHMSVYENMAFGLKLRKLPKKEIDQRVREAARILGIEELLDRKPKALSGGQRQRVAVGRAIVRKPKVFLFDEPLSNLDAKLRVQMRMELSRLHRQLEATMIYVTHDQTEAMTMGETIVLMKDGHVQQVASPIEIYSKPANKFVAGFIGSPAMNFFEGKLTKGKRLVFSESGGGFEIGLPAKYLTHLKPFVGKSLTLGLRPENIQRSTPSTPVSERVKGVADVVEPMGNESFVYFTVRGSNLHSIARFPAGKEPAAGESLTLHFDVSSAHFFDSTTGESILSNPRKTHNKKI